MRYTILFLNSQGTGNQTEIRIPIDHESFYEGRLFGELDSKASVHMEVNSGSSFNYLLCNLWTPSLHFVISRLIYLNTFSFSFIALDNFFSSYPYNLLL